MSDKPRGVQPANREIATNKAGRINESTNRVPLPNSREPASPAGASRPVHDTLPPPPRKPK